MNLSHVGQQTRLERRPPRRITQRHGQRTTVPVLGAVVVVVHERHHAQPRCLYGVQIGQQAGSLGRVVGRQAGGREMQPLGVQLGQVTQVLPERGKTVVVPVDVEPRDLGPARRGAGHGQRGRGRCNARATDRHPLHEGPLFLHRGAAQQAQRRELGAQHHAHAQHRQQQASRACQQEGNGPQSAPAATSRILKDEVLPIRRFARSGNRRQGGAWHIPG